MKRVLSQLRSYFVIVLAMLAAWSMVGFVTIYRIPIEESNLGNFRIPLLILCIVVPLCGCLLASLAAKAVFKNLWIYEQILDSIPFPITVTDINMKCLFVNKTVCDLLKKERDKFYGQPCSIWNTPVCKTEDCGIVSLKKGKPNTKFSQFGRDFNADVFWIYDDRGNKTGHIELLRDITIENSFQKQQAEAVDNLNAVTNSFALASRQISDGSQSLARGANEQATVVDQLSATVVELDNMAKENMQTATDVSREESEVVKMMSVCIEQMQQMLDAMKIIDEKSQIITKTTIIIDDIAFQTNILALNAAVEAARAGQHGKGFAVVADEVRNLASKSAEAARETADLIESSSQSVTEGNKIVEKVNASLQAVTELMQINVKKISDLQAVSVRQSEAVTNVSYGIDKVANVVQQNSATSEELAATSEEMNSQASQLQEMVNALSENKAHEH